MAATAGPQMQSNRPEIVPAAVELGQLAAAPPPSGARAHGGVRTRNTSTHRPAAPREWRYVAIATLAVVGAPVGLMWTLRAYGVVVAMPVAVVIGLAASLSVSQLGCRLWARRAASGDLLFSELPLWGYLSRWRAQRRLASAADLLGPIGRSPLAPIRGRNARQRVRMLERLVASVEHRDPYLHGHSRRVARHSWRIARRMGLSRGDVARVRAAAALHDVGKVNTPLVILHKPAALSDEEFAVVKRHPAEGAAMAEVLEDRQLVEMIRYHHERLDGSGYPDGITGRQIPLGARIIAVADTFDAITSARPYRAARAHSEAIAILKAEAGTKLDPAVVKAFCAHYAGRRSVALWSSLPAVAERFASLLAGGAGGVASTVNAVAVAAVIGGAAAASSAAALPRQGVSNRPRTGVQAAAQVPATSAAQNATGARLSLRRGSRPVVPRRAHSARTLQPRARRASAIGAPAIATLPLQSPSHAEGASTSGGAGSSGGPAAVNTAGSGSPGQAQQQLSQSAGRGKLPLAPGESASSTSTGRRTTAAREEVHGRAEEVHGDAEEVHGKVEEVHPKAEEVVHAKAEEVRAKAEEVRGKEAVVHGKAEELVHGKAEELVHGKAEELVHGVAEAAHGKSAEAIAE